MGQYYKMYLRNLRDRGRIINDKGKRYLSKAQIKFLNLLLTSYICDGVEVIPQGIPGCFKGFVEHSCSNKFFNIYLLKYTFHFDKIITLHFYFVLVQGLC